MHRLLYIRIIVLCNVLLFALSDGEIITKEIPENAPEGFVVHEFNPPPSDKEYSFYQAPDANSQRALKWFEISPSGKVTIKHSLSYETSTDPTRNTYSLIVLLKETGSDVTGGEASTLRVKVTDSNNFSPLFWSDMYNGTIAENSPSGTYVQGLDHCYAEDRDTSGIKGYGILTGNEKEYFQISTDTVGSRKYLILKTTNKPIIRSSTNSPLVLTVVAEDGGNPSLSATTQISIRIVDINNNQPTFHRNNYQTVVQENAQFMTSVITVRATDRDRSLNGAVYYYLAQRSSYFEVNPLTGVVWVVGELSYSQSPYELQILARDRGLPTKQSSTRVTIKIRADIPGYPQSNPSPTEDLPPYFPNGPYFTDLFENYPVRGLVTIIKAEQRGSESDILNTRIRYVLTGDNSRYFQIEPRNGIVNLNSKLDYEAGPKVFDFKVTATVQGTSSELSASTDFKVVVQDTSDNQYSPVFDPPYKEVTLNENVPIGHTVTRVTAGDKDPGPDGTVVYSIVAGTGLGLFEVGNSTGILKTAAPLDFEKQRSYDLVIQATDSSEYFYTSRLNLLISLQNLDDNLPDFSQLMYSAQVVQGSPKNTFVTYVFAVDKDDTEGVSYRLSGSEAFKIDSVGLIRTTRTFDPIRGDKEFTLTVTASNSGKSSEALVHVKIVPKANSKPRFTKTSYSVSVPENEDPGRNLLCMAATSSSGLPVKYAIIAGGFGKFGINSVSGRLYTIGRLDFESVSSYKLSVQALDEKQNLKSTAEVQVTVTNKNDPPKFKEKTYGISLNEDVKIGTTILDGDGRGFIILDDDTDGSNFDCSIYDVQSLAVLEYFNITRVKVDCRLATKLAFDTSVKSKFEFSVRATDKSNPAMSATAKVTVTIQDKNDHAPVFSQFSYWKSVRSDIDKESSVIQVVATDKDSGVNGDVNYYIVNDDMKGNSFAVDAVTGVVTVAYLLKENTKYEMKVRAQDRGNPSKFSEVIVSISVYDSTQTPLVIQPVSYSADLKENVPQATDVFRVRSQGPSDWKTEYSIVGGNVGRVFGIDFHTGQVTVSKSLNYETIHQYKLAIRVTMTNANPSNGLAQMASDAIGTVNIENINDNKPKFAVKADPTKVWIENYTPPDSTVIQIRAFDVDDDQAGSIKYSISQSSSVPSSGLPFSIDEKSGVINTTKNIRYSERSTYMISVQARDSEGSTSSTRVWVQVVDSISPPTFEQKTYEATISKNVQIGTSVYTMAPRFSGGSSVLRYNIVSGNSGNVFCIDDSGLITIAQSLMGKSATEYKLEVVVGLGTSKDKCVVNIKLIKASSAPQFSKSLYTATVSEDKVPVAEIVRVTATEEKAGAIKPITYSLEQAIQTQSVGIFEVDKSNGAVMLKKQLDYEQLLRHVLYVKAEDSDKRKALTKVIINVQDVNDNQPKFPSSHYRVKLPLQAPVGYTVIQIRASDLDSKTNGEIMYNITSGNEKGIFQITPETGVISLASPVQYPPEGEFNLVIDAEDKLNPSVKDTSTVEMRVDPPDGPPVFTTPVFTVKVKEGEPPNTKITQVRAATARTVLYSIQSGNIDGMFKVEHETGKILSRRTLDYEENPGYSLVIKAEDSEDNSATVTVKVDLIDINDNIPTFEDGSTITRLVPLPAIANEPAAIVYAHDGDPDDRTTYEISSAFAITHFAIDENGRLYFKETMDLDKVLKIFGPIYTFKLTAKDAAKPPHTATVSVKLLFVHYRPEELPVTCDVPEDAKVKQVVAIVPRYYPDSEMSIIYPEQTTFAINNKGEVTLEKLLDYEKVKFYVLTAQEKLKPGKGKWVNNVDIEVTVLDRNDHDPVLLMKSRIGTVNGNSRAGARIMHLSGMDKDLGLNGLPALQLEADHDLTLNPITGWLQNAGQMQKNSYDVNIYPYDYGIPRRDNKPFIVKIYPDQRPPIFKKDIYKFKLPEISQAGTIIGVVKATSASNAVIGYSIIAGNNKKLFKITPLGQIKLNTFIDFEKDATSYLLRVNGSEQIPNALFSLVDVEIHLTDTNEYSPRFTQPVYHATVKEDAVLGSRVISVSAGDCDCIKGCKCVNKNLKYSLVDGSKSFIISTNTGQIVTSKRLDYETTSFYALQVTADDFQTGSEKAIAYVNITVLNANDNPPVFSKSKTDITITNDAVANKPLARITATDPDHKLVSYSIVSGEGSFRIDSSTGVISLAKQLLENSKKTQYTLLVRAKDNGIDGTLYKDERVVINIKPNLRGNPQFKVCKKELTVKENLPAGTIVLQVDAEAHVKKPQGGHVEFKLQEGGSFAHERFTINKATGTITTVRPLDREKLSVYELFVTAEDGGLGINEAQRLLGLCLVRVTVEDTNDQYPYFFIRQYKGSVWQNSPAGTYILTVVARDGDLGANAEVQYKLTVPSDKFILDSVSGVIKTRRDLSSFEGVVSMTVEVSNTQPMDNPASEEEKRELTVEVVVTVSSRKPPSFTQSVFKASVRENTPTGASILTVSAKSNPPGNRILYSSLHDYSIHALFGINTLTGVITKKGEIDFEEKKIYRDQVEAREEATGLVSSGFVEITVLDVNDDSPTFILDKFLGRVSENAPVGTSVLTVRATDRDTGKQGEVIYFLDPKKTSSQYFTVDETTGKITTKVSFDREKQGAYTLHVFARDKGVPHLEDEVYVYIQIVDVNDHPPSFEKSEYSVKILENAAVSTLVMRLNATDIDVGDKLDLKYFISGGDNWAVFAMKTVVQNQVSAGLMLVARPLDYESLREYVIQVSASDGRDSDSVRVVVMVEDVNDNTPVFTTLMYSVSIQEHSPSGTSVVTVIATDRDTSAVQQAIQYSIEKRWELHFSINSVTGLITTRGEGLDREKGQVVYFRVYAFDGKFTGHAEVAVTLIDINDHAPLLLKPPYVGYIMENEPPGTAILPVQAVDHDDITSKNTIITYTLTNDAGGRFAINQSTGMIYSKVFFDRETLPNRFFVDVRATDNGQPPLHATTKAEIIVTDANDFTPQFTNDVYYASVSELAIPGEEVIQIVVLDKDEQQNSQSEFIITHGNNPRAFFINPDTGMIHVSGKLNYDLKKDYNLTIEVWDRGMPPLKSEQPTFVIINITDDNDHIPEFIPKGYTASIYENATINTFVVMVTAMDNDTNISYPLTYSITNGDDYGAFNIIANSSNTSTAVIVVSGPLDRESISSYQLSVTVTDTGGLSAIAIVIVTILDVNDNGPHFVPPYYRGKVKEKLDSKQLVATLSVHDRDEPGNGQPFTYRIINGTFGADFRLEEASGNTVKLSAYGIFLRTKRTEYTILIMASDNGTPQRYSYTYVYVIVIDNQNLYEPFGSRMKIIVHAYDGYFRGGIIGRAYYQDNDYLGDTNVYTLKSQSKSSDQRAIEYFSIKSTTGDITALKGLSIGTYSLTVSVEETSVRKGASSQKTVTSLVEVVVVPVSRRNVEQSMTVQFMGVDGVSHFVSRYYVKVQSTIFNVISSMTLPVGYNGPFAPISMYSREQVLIFSLRKPSDSSNSVYAQIAVVGATNELDILFRYEKARLIQQLRGLQIGQIWLGGPDTDPCALELQTVGLCTNKLIYNSYQVVSGDIGQVPAPNASLTVLSLNVSKKAEYNSSLNPLCNCSTNNPCLNGGTCHEVLPTGCVCECPVQYSTTPNCMKSILRTFMASRKSYLWIHTLAETNRGALQFDFTTKVPNGLMLYQGPGMYAMSFDDFLAIHLANGYIRVTISLGSDPISVELTKGARLDDGEWHTVEVIRDLKEIRVVIDKCENAQVMDVGGRIIEDRSTCEISGVAKGLSVYLNAAGNLQIGGVENPDQQYPNISYSGFTGCIRNIIDNGNIYDLEKPLRNWMTMTGCVVTSFSCPSCRNQGNCEPQMNRKGKCICYPGFHGDSCERNNIAVRYLNRSFSQYISRSFTSQTTTTTTTTTVNSRKRRSTTSCKDVISHHRRYQTDIRLQIRVEQNFTEGVLFLATNAYGSEFHRVDVKDGIVRYVFRLGDRMKILRLGGVNITDGKYHNVSIKREGDFATVQLDYKVKVSGRTGGKFSLLDLSGGSIFVGGFPSNLTAALISAAFVDSGGKALVLTSDGKIVSSGSGSYGSSTAWSSSGGYTIVQLDSTGHVSHVRKRYHHKLKFFQSLYGARALYPMSRVPKRKVVFKNNCFLGSPEAALGAGLRQINQTAGTHIYKSGIWGRRLLVATVLEASNQGSTQKTIINQNSGTNSGQNSGSTSVQGSSSVPGQGSASSPGQGLAPLPGQGSATVSGQSPQPGSGQSCVPLTGAENGTRFIGSGEYGAALHFAIPDSVNGTFARVIDDLQRGCVSQSRMDNVDLDHDNGTAVRRQNVVEKCTLCNITCKNGGKCIGGDPPRCQCPLAFMGPTCEQFLSIPVDHQGKITNPPTWTWAGYLAYLLPLIILLALLITWLCWKSKEPEKPAVVENGHGNIRAYHDDGVGDVDNMDFDMKHLIKYSYVNRVHVGHHSSSANIRDYTDAGVGDVDNLNYDLSKLTKHTYWHNKGFSSSQQEVNHVVITKERRQLQGATSHAHNIYQHDSDGNAKRELLLGNGSSTELSSLPSETTSINGSSSSSLVNRRKSPTGSSSPPQALNLAHLVNTRKHEVDRAPLIPGDDSRHYSYEGQDSDAGDLSDIDLAEEDKTHTVDLSKFLHPTPSKTRV